MSTPAVAAPVDLTDDARPVGLAALHEDIERLEARVRITLEAIEDVLEDARGVALWP